MNTKNDLFRFQLYASIFLFFAFIILLIQNVIRYGDSPHYNVWSSIIYLFVSLIVFTGLIPVFYYSLKKISLKGFGYYAISGGASLLILIAFYAISNSLFYLMDYYDSIPDVVYARRYFGREALFHLIVLVAGSFFLNPKGSKADERFVSATLGRKLVTIKAIEVRWIETDDHYLKIHTHENALVKRATMDQMVSQLGPQFIRIHRKYLVNREQILGKERKGREEFVILKSGERLKVGRSFSPISIS